jgi:hypothetical protein
VWRRRVAVVRERREAEHAEEAQDDTSAVTATHGG